MPDEILSLPCRECPLCGAREAVAIGRIGRPPLCTLLVACLRCQGASQVLDTDALAHLGGRPPDCSQAR